MDIRKQKSNTLHKQISLPWQKLEVVEQDSERNNPLTAPEIIHELSHLSEQMKSEGTSDFALDL